MQKLKIENSIFKMEDGKRKRSYRKGAKGAKKKKSF
jgi:hypothetical protein